MKHFWDEHGPGLIAFSVFMGVIFLCIGLVFKHLGNIPPKPTQLDRIEAKCDQLIEIGESWE
jgi:hypothetical protein